jgi:class 3 adenylate cyclase
VSTRALCPVLIGRERELGLLEDALLASVRGEGQVVVLAGDAGIGKTRLAAELSRRAIKVGCAVMTGSCSEAELALPYLPFLEALGNFLGATDLDQLRGRLGPGRRELAQLFPQLGSGRPPVYGGDPAEAKLRLFEAILGLLRIPADHTGLLLVIEDLQWLDASARELLDYLTRRLGDSRILVLATYRREELHRRHPVLPTIQRWRRSGVATVVELEPMSAEEVAGMMRAIFDEERVTDEFRDFMHGRTEGNPFVLEEMLKSALDQKDIFFRPVEGLWDRKALGELQMPPTVRDTILLRVDRLTTVEAEVLRAAAVLGRSFDYSILMAVSGREQSIVEGAMEAATQQQLIEEDPGVPGRCRFRHALTQEAIYSDLSALHRERLHLAAAETLRLKSDAAAADVAYHLMAAKRWADAEPVCLQAADAAKAQRGYREAAALYARMIPHLSDPQKQGRFRCLLGAAYYSAGDYAEALRSLDRGVSVLEKHNAAREASHYRLVLGQCHWDKSQPALARAEFERVRTSLESEGPSEDLAFAYVSLARLHLLDAEYRDALALADRGIEVAVAAGADAPRIWGYNYRGSALASLGQTAEGLVDLDRSYEEAVERRLDWITSSALFNRVAVHLVCFRPEAALESVELLRALGGLDSAWAADLECTIRFSLGEPAKAKGAGEEALALARQADASTLAAKAEMNLALACSALGSFEEARRLIGRHSSGLEREDVGLLTEARLRVDVDEGDFVSAMPLAQAVLSDLSHRTASVYEAWLIDKVVEVFVEAELRAEAAMLLDIARQAPISADNPYLSRIEGRLALADGDLSRARDCFQAAADFFARVSYRDDAWRTRRALAGVMMQVGDRPHAEADLCAVVAEADEHGHVTEAKAARRQLSELGVELPTAAAVMSMPEVALRPVSERFVTIMFVDIRGYTAFTATAAPPDLADRVATFYRWTEQEIARHHGMVAQYGGDAMMAAFNVSGVRLDHCLDALQAAIAIRDKAAFNGLPVGVGIAVGGAVLGQLTQSAPLTALGTTTNLAARLQAHAQAGEIVLSAEAFQRVRDWISSQKFEARDTMLTLKGFDLPVSAFVLPARASASTRA